MDDEIESFECNDTFTLALVPDYKKLAGKKWEYRDVLCSNRL